MLRLVAFMLPYIPNTIVDIDLSGTRPTIPTT